MLEDEPVTDIHADFPLQHARQGGRVQLTFADILPIIAKITSVEEDYPDGSGVLRTAYGWRKQQVNHGGQLVDSDDGVEGLKPADDPPQWPAFSVNDEHEFAVDDYALVFPARFDGLQDAAENHGLEWLAIPFPSDSKHSTWIRFALPSALSTTDAFRIGCTVDDYWGGPDPGATVTVYNPDAKTDYIFSGETGAKGLATWDDISEIWWIVQMECNTAGGDVLVDLVTGVTNVLTSGNGGTGRSTLTSGQLLMGNGIDPVDMVDRISGGTF